MSATLLYLGRVPDDQVHDLIFAGVCRYAEARGWGAESIPWRESREDRMPAIFASRKPVGCIVECSNGPPDLPPRIFGRIPVVFTNCLSARRGNRIVRVVVDDEAVAYAAFRELSAGRPESFAVAPFRMPQPWSRARIAAFQSLARKSGKPCHVLRVRDPDAEDRAQYDARLSAWVATLPHHCAIFAANDATASEIAAAAAANRRPMPRDLTLVGVDDNAVLCDGAATPITSIPMDFENAGLQAAKALDGILSRKDPSPPRRSTLLLVKPLLVTRRESTRGSGRREPRIRQAVEMIRREACAGLAASAIIARFSGSRRLFEMRFREAMGHSVLDEIQHVRLEKVFTLLSRTDTPISAIAALCGYGSDIELRQFFRVRTGMSLREWRQRNAW